MRRAAGSHPAPDGLNVFREHFPRFGEQRFSILPAHDDDEKASAWRMAGRMLVLGSVFGKLCVMTDHPQHNSASTLDAADQPS